LPIDHRLLLARNSELDSLKRKFHSQTPRKNAP
jgi:hypothetical protein